MSRQRPISLGSARGFLAAARHLSFTRAAVDLHVTQSALSRQVQSLESEIGQPLFVRETRELKLTEAGARLLRVVEPWLTELDRCVSQIRHQSTRKRVTVTSFASFISMWLIPRIGAFSALRPDIDLHFQAADRFVDLDDEEIDVAIRYSLPNALPPGAEILATEQIFPVCSPALVARADPPLQSVADIAAQTLLLQESTTSTQPWLVWEQWFAEAGLAKPSMRKTLRFTNHDQIIQAALVGQGVALGRHLLVEPMLRLNQLVRLSPVSMTTSHVYGLLVAPGSANVEEVQAFVAWIKEEIGRASAE